MLESIVLGMLFERDLAGYDLKKAIENGIGVFYKASYGSLYPALKRLTQKGLLTTYEQPQGSRPKIFYRITQEGKAVFLAWLCAPMELLEGTNTHLAKVYFFDQLPPPQREQQLLAYEANNLAYLQKLQALEQKFSALPNKECFYFKLSTLYYGICVTQKTIQWCRHLRKGAPLPGLLEQEMSG